MESDYGIPFGAAPEPLCHHSSYSAVHRFSFAPGCSAGTALILSSQLCRGLAGGRIGWWGWDWHHEIAPSYLGKAGLFVNPSCWIEVDLSQGVCYHPTVLQAPWLPAVAHRLGEQTECHMQTELHERPAGWGVVTAALVASQVPVPGPWTGGQHTCGDRLTLRVQGWADNAPAHPRRVCP